MNLPFASVATLATWQYELKSASLGLKSISILAPSLITPRYYFCKISGNLKIIRTFAAIFYKKSHFINQKKKKKSMRKLLLAMCVSLISMGAQAQDEEKNELSASYGVGISTIGDGIGNAIGNGLIDSWSGCEWDASRFGTLGIEYFRHF